ncbi:MAG: hypothetical protein AB7E81_13320 [Hyphomicrobiaceae bacterium]
MKTLVLSFLLAAGLVVAPVVSADAAPRKRSKPLSVPIYKKHYGKYRGGYSYHYVDAIDTRRFVDPTLNSQSQGGPFDSGFFFETPRGPYGGTTPYFH